MNHVFKRSAFAMLTGVSVMLACAGSTLAGPQGGPRPTSPSQQGAGGVKSSRAVRGMLDRMKSELRRANGRSEAALGDEAQNQITAILDLVDSGASDDVIFDAWGASYDAMQGVEDAGSAKLTQISERYRAFLVRRGASAEVLALVDRALEKANRQLNKITEQSITEIDNALLDWSDSADDNGDDDDSGDGDDDGSGHGGDDGDCGGSGSGS